MAALIHASQARQMLHVTPQPHSMPDKPALETIGQGDCALSATQHLASHSPLVQRPRP